MKAESIYDKPTYGYPEASNYLRIPVSTLRTWSTSKGGLFVPAGVNPAMLSFHNLVEIYVLAGIRREHKVSMPRLKKALNFVRKNMKIDRPLIHKEFLTDGVELFVEGYETELITVSRSGQLAFKELIINTLERIDHDPNGIAIRLYPWMHKRNEPRYFEIDPRRSFGRLVLAGTGIPTEIIGERFRAGESINDLSEDYRLEKLVVENALRWESFVTAA